MWTRERPFAAVAFATSSRIQTDRNERRLKDECREREERGGTVPPLTLPRGGGGEKRWESGQIVPFDPPRGRFPRLLLVRRYENLPAHDKRGFGAKIERIRFAFWLLCSRRRGVRVSAKRGGGVESETVGREIRV